MNINLHIEKLVLDGIATEPHHLVELKSTVEATLSQSIITQRLSSAVQSNNNLRSLSCGSISIDNINIQKNLGQKIADAVYRGIIK